MGVFSGRERWALAVLLFACLPRDDLSTYSSEWGVATSGSGGNAGSASEPPASDAGADSGQGGSSAPASPDPSRDAGDAAAATAGDLDASPDAAFDAAAPGVLGAIRDGG